MGYADNGIAHLSGARASSGARPGHPAVGFTAPAFIYDKMKNTDAGSRELATLVTVYVTRQAFKDAWATWLGNWQKFFAKYQTLSGQMGALLYTDDLNSQADAYAAALTSWRDAYAREKDAQGNALPEPVSPAPPAPAPSETPKGFIAAAASQIPWWGWLMGGALVAGTGYALYKMHQAQMANVRELMPTLKATLPTLIAPEASMLRAATTGHDCGHDCSGPAFAKGDPGPRQLGPITQNYVKHSYDPDYTSPEPDFDVASDFEKNSKGRRSLW